MTYIDQIDATNKMGGKKGRGRVACGGGYFRSKAADTCRFLGSERDGT